MLRLLLDPEALQEGRYDHALQLACIIEQQCFREIGSHNITINSLRRGAVSLTERDRDYHIKSWMADQVISVREGEANVAKATKTAGCFVEYVPVVVPDQPYTTAQLQEAFKPYYDLADKLVIGIRKAFADKLPAVEVAEAPVAEEPVVEEPIAEEPVDAVAEEVAEPTS